MSRLYGREDWRLAASGIVAGVGTFVLVCVVWFSSLGGGETHTTTRTPDDAEGPIIGAFQSGVVRTLGEAQPSTRALRGPLRLNARNLEWAAPNGRTFARADRIQGELNSVAVGDGDVLLSNVVVSDPEVFLRQAGPEDWNFQAVFEELLNAPETPGPKRRIIVDGLRIASGYVDVTRPDDAFSFRNLDANIARLTLSSPALPAPVMIVSSMDAVFERPSSRTRLPVHVADARLTFPDGTATFDVQTATIENTRLADVTGVWNPAWGGYAIEAEGRALDVQLADFRSFAPERFPEDGTASFAFQVRPLADDGTDVALTDLTFNATGAAATGALAFQFFPTRFQLGDMDLQVESLALSLLERVLGRELPYGGTITGTVRGPARDISLDLLATLTSPGSQSPFTTRVTGSIAMLEQGLAVQQLSADLDRVPLSALEAFIPGIPFAGVLTGSVAFSGSPATTPLQLDMRLEVGTGLATVNGMLDLTGALPRYDVTGRIIGVDLQSVLEPDVPPVTFGARFALNGSGFKPEQIDARLNLNGGFTGWQSNPGDTLLASIRVRNGAAEVDTLVGRLATASMNAQGQWRFLEPIAGAVEYSLAVTSLAPFGQYLPVIGDSASAGAVTGSGTISGTLDRMRLAGELTAEEARSGGWTASEFAATYDITLGGRLPEVRFEGVGRGIGTPTAGTYAVATAKVEMSPPFFSLDFDAQRSEGAGAIEIAATGTIPETGANELFLRNAFFDLQDTRWELARPARIAWNGDGDVRVDSLEFRNDSTAGEFMLHGQVYPIAEADFDARVAALPVGEIQELIGRTPVVRGLVWAEATVRPPGNAPFIDLDFRLENGDIQGVPVTHLSGTLDYAAQRASANFTVALDTAGSLVVDAALPVAIDLTGAGEYAAILDAGALTGTITAQRFSLAPVDSFVTLVRGVRGQLDGVVTLGGTVTEPQLNGTLALTQGNVVVPRLNQTYTDISGAVDFTGRVATLRDVRAYSDGVAELAGAITFQELTEPVFDVRATLVGFRPLGVDNQDDAAMDGTVTLAGPFNSLRMTGNVLVRDGYFLIPQFGADLTNIYGDLTAAAPVLGRDFTPEATAPWLRNLVIDDLGVELADVWIAAQEARLQLSGDLSVNKSQDDYRILGELEGQRGTYTLMAGPIVRRFDITSATVRFRGSTDINPVIDVNARRIVLNPGGGRMNVDVNIGGTVRAPTISLASADVPNLPESELLSFLLFGRSSLAIGPEGLNSGVETLFGGVGEVIGLELERAVVGELGLPVDVFQVRFGPDGAPSLVLGRQLGTDFFLTFESGSTALAGENEGGGMNDWAIRLEWAFQDQSSLQLGFEPVRGSRIRGLSRVLSTDDPQQLFAELRRRWSW